MRVGVIGLGRMGAAMAARLQDVGHQMVVWNRSPEKADALVKAGARLAASPADLAGDVEFILTMLYDIAAVNSVFHGKDGILSADLTGKMVIEMSTVRPSEALALADSVRAAGGAYMECPVGGSVGVARSGSLLGLVGAQPEDLARGRPILEQLCRRVEHVGPVGAGAAMKLAVNLPLLVFLQAFGEANALIRHLGLNPEHLIELFAETSGGPNFLKARGKAVAAALADGDTGAVNFNIDLVAKDLRIMAEEAASRGFNLPLVEKALSVTNQASAEGWGDRDSTWMPAFWARKGDK